MSDDWGFGIIMAFIVAVAITFLVGIGFAIQDHENKTDKQFKSDCIALGGNPVLKDDRMCIKGDKIIFQRD